MKWIKIDAELPPQDFVCSIKLAGKKICLIRHQGMLYATQYFCPHAGGVLAGGWCKDGNLICPIHRREYHLQTGRGVAGQGDCMDVYPIEIREEGIFVGFVESFWSKLFSK